MTPPEKPEWIEIADADSAATPRRVSKKLPALALIITATIIGAGAVFGQTADQSPASAATALAPVVQSSTSAQPDATNTSPSTQVSTSVVSSSKERTAPVVTSVSTQNVSPVITPATSTIKNPSIGTLPTKGGDDSHENNGDDEEGDD
ncbi:MAG: hypothetical protein WCJ16_06315 [Actinomycetes bacterium]|jgi:hypothetical protein